MEEEGVYEVQGHQIRPEEQKGGMRNEYQAAKELRARKQILGKGNTK